MYARRQRRVQSANTNAQIQIFWYVYCLKTTQDDNRSLQFGLAVTDGIEIFRDFFSVLTGIPSRHGFAVPRRYPNAKPMPLINSNREY